MTQFTEAFYKVYRKTQETLASSQREWQREVTSSSKGACPSALIALHEEQVKLYEKLLRLVALWGVYCIQYTADAKSVDDLAWLEDRSLKELEIIVGETK